MVGGGYTVEDIAVLFILCVLPWYLSMFPNLLSTCAKRRRFRGWRGKSSLCLVYIYFLHLFWFLSSPEKEKIPSSETSVDHRYRTRLPAMRTRIRWGRCLSCLFIFRTSSNHFWHTQKVGNPGRRRERGRKKSREKEDSRPKTTETSSVRGEVRSCWFCHIHFSYVI